MPTMKPMPQDEQSQHDTRWLTIKSAVIAIAAVDDGSEDVAVALARLKNWMDENAGRWVA